MGTGDHIGDWGGLSLLGAQPFWEQLPCMGQRSQPPQVFHIGHSCHLNLDPATYIIRTPHTYFNLQYSGRNLWDLLLQHFHEPDRLLHGRAPKEESWILPPSSVHPLWLPQALCLLPVRQAPFKNYVLRKNQNQTFSGTNMISCVPPFLQQEHIGHMLKNIIKVTSLLPFTIAIFQSVLPSW